MITNTPSLHLHDLTDINSQYGNPDRFKQDDSNNPLPPPPPATSFNYSPQQQSCRGIYECRPSVYAGDIDDHVFLFDLCAQTYHLSLHLF